MYSITCVLNSPKPNFEVRAKEGNRHKHTHKQKMKQSNLYQLGKVKKVTLSPVLN
jgi:hypothetical protein